MSTLPATREPNSFSYRHDPAVPKFDDSKPLIIFDGLCVLCSTGVQFMLARNPHGTSRFATIQQLIPQTLYRHYGLDAAKFDTFMVLDKGLAHIKWRGLLAAANTMGTPWKILAGLGRIIPTAIGDRIYDVVQNNRIAWFGARASCFVPNSAQKARFL